MSPTQLFWEPTAIPLLRVLAAALVGRVALALLPAGRVGTHSGRDGGTTLIASLLLGNTLLRAVVNSFPGATAWVSAGALVLGGLWMWLGPHAFVPQAAWRHHAPAWHTALLFFAALALASVVPDFHLAEPERWLWSLVLVECFTFGAGRARLASGPSVLVGLALLGSVFALGSRVFVLPTLELFAAAAFIVDASRNADRRSLWLGALLAVGCSELSPALTVSLWSAAWLAAHPNARKSVLAAIGAGAGWWLVRTLIATAHAPLEPARDATLDAWHWEGWSTELLQRSWPWVVALVVAAIGLLGWNVARGARSGETASAWDRGRVVRALGAVVVLTLLLTSLQARSGWNWAWFVLPDPTELGLALVPLVALLGALIAVPSEREA